METIIEAGKAFTFHCKFEKGLSSKTIKAYTFDLEQFLSFLETNNYGYFLNEIDKLVIKEYLKFLSNKKPKTIKRKIATIKALYSFLEYEDEILINPFRKIRIHIKEPMLLPSVLNIYEVKLIFQKVYSLKYTVNNKKSYLYFTIVRDIAILELLFATGVRVSELCNLKTYNIGNNFSFINVNGKGNRERTIQICNHETIDALKEYQKLLFLHTKKVSFFFVNRNKKQISDQSIRFMIRKYTKLVGIKHHITPHTFRHTFATLLLEEGVDLKYIQHLLGHSSIMTTQIYAHVNKTKQKQILKTKHPRRRFNMCC